jgi:hypothetical protein
LTHLVFGSRCGKEQPRPAGGRAAACSPQFILVTDYEDLSASGDELATIIPPENSSRAGLSVRGKGVQCWRRPFMEVLYELPAV